MKIVVTAWIAALALGSAGLADAQDIYKWTDNQGQTHYSNHGGSPGDSSPGPGADSGEQGWESVLEKQKGAGSAAGNVQDRAEAMINDLQLQLLRKKRDRALAQEALETTQASIVRSQSTGAADVPMLRAREATQINDLRKVDAEIAVMEASVAKLRALKTAEQEQRSTQ